MSMQEFRSMIFLDLCLLKGHENCFQIRGRYARTGFVEAHDFYLLFDSIQWSITNTVIPAHLKFDWFTITTPNTTSPPIKTTLNCWCHSFQSRIQAPLTVSWTVAVSSYGIPLWYPVLASFTNPVLKSTTIRTVNWYLYRLKDSSTCGRRPKITTVVWVRYIQDRRLFVYSIQACIHIFSLIAFPSVRN